MDALGAALASAAATVEASEAAAAATQAASEEERRLERIRAAFSIFDPSGSGTIPEEEVPTVLRYLDVFVSDRDFVDKVLVELHGDEPKPFVRRDRFEEVVVRLMESHEYDPDGAEVLMAAFRALDPEGKGYIDADKMRHLLSTNGEPPFAEKEIESFFKVALAPPTTTTTTTAGSDGGAASGSGSSSGRGTGADGGKSSAASAGAGSASGDGTTTVVVPSNKIAYDDYVALVTR